MNVDIASRLVSLRKKYGYSQESLAEQLGISRQAVSKWERAEASPDTDNLITLAGLYGISLDDLLNTGKELPGKGMPTAKTEESVQKERGVYDYSVQFNDNNAEDGGSSMDEDAGQQGEGATESATKASAEFEENRDRKHRGGITVNDEDSFVHVGWDGIHVFDKKDGTKVKVDWTGVHVKDVDCEVNVDGDSVFVKDADGKYRAKVGGAPISDAEKANDYEDWENWGWGDKRKNLFQRLPLGILATIAFILVVALTGIWHPTWMIFLLIPVVDSFITAIAKRDFHKFAYPVLAFDVFLWIGFQHNLWHPGWVLFLTIPVFYAIFPKRTKECKSDSKTYI